MTTFDPIGLWLAASVLTGVTAHAALVVRDRRTYRRLRDAYVGTVATAQETGAADALVHAQELHREFMRATWPGWFGDLGARLKAAFVLCAVVCVGLMVATGRLPPVVAGVAVLFAVGLRRLMLTTALLLALFAATAALSPPPPADHAPAAHLVTPPRATKPPVRSP
jgi:hypothetical protein